MGWCYPGVGESPDPSLRLNWGHFYPAMSGGTRRLIGCVYQEPRSLLEKSTFNTVLNIIEKKVNLSTVKCL